MPAALGSGSGSKTGGQPWTVISDSPAKVSLAVQNTDNLNAVLDGTVENQIVAIRENPKAGAQILAGFADVGIFREGNKPLFD